MSNLHPGLVLIATGIIAAIVPKSLRKYVLAGGPLVALAAMFSLSYGAEWVVPFINGIDLPGRTGAGTEDTDAAVLLEIVRLHSQLFIYTGDHQPNGIQYCTSDKFCIRQTARPFPAVSPR